MVVHVNSLHGDWLFEGDVCREGFLTKDDMIFHVNSVHRDWLFHCDVCGQGFLTKYNMIIHVNTVHEVCHFTVMFVESCFMNFTDLKLHMDACREDSTSCRFSCDVCGEGLFTKDNMIIHVNTVHKAWQF